MGWQRSVIVLLAAIAVAGILAWSYDMVDVPLTPSDGVRGRLGEAVLAKWHAILGGEN